MKTWLFFAVSVGMAWGALADDLLDEVLYWDRPPSKPRTEQETSVEVPAARRERGAREREENRREELQRRRLEDAERRAADAEAVLASGEERAVPEVAMEEEVVRDAAGMESRTRLSGRLGGGGSSAIAADAELTIPLGNSPLDLSLKCFSRTAGYTMEGSYQERHRTVYCWVDGCIENTAGEAVLLWRPFRGELFSPYVGAGARYEQAEVETSSESVAGRVGLTLNLGAFWLNGEYSGASASNEASGTLGWRCRRHFALKGFAEWFDGKGYGLDAPVRKDSFVYGVGLMWVF